MPIRGVRGATTVSANEADLILAATRNLLEEMIRSNGIAAADVAAALFTVTPDLNAAFPARAARELGWQHVPLMDAVEIAVPGSLPRCIRILLLWNTEKPQDEILHIYQGETRSLRPDLLGQDPPPQEKEKKP
ncbi:MAG: chorismate mutase [Chloroflexi bacterium]|nr:chorismate mutase [Chloroflexota bacterium]